MKSVTVAAILCCARLLAQYQYDYSSSLTTIDTNQWWSNGVVTPTGSGLTSSDATGGSLIWKGQITNTAGDTPGLYEYEINTTIRLANSGGGYFHYHWATSNALTNALQGTYYSVELIGPVLSGGSGTANLSLFKRNASGYWLLAQAYVPAHDGMVMRSVRQRGRLDVYLDGVFYAATADSETLYTTGAKPGIGVAGTPAGNSISQVSFGKIDRTPPPQVSAASAAVAAFPNAVDMRWAGTGDDANGIGLKTYDIYRDGAYVLGTRTPAFTDSSVAPGQTHTYRIIATDYHYRPAPPTDITVTVPPAGYIDPRRVGVQPLGRTGALPERTSTCARAISTSRFRC